MSKGHSIQGPKIPFIRNLKKSTRVSKRDVLWLAILRYVLHKDVWDAGFQKIQRLFLLYLWTLFLYVMSLLWEKIVWKKNRPKLIPYHRTRVVLLNMLKNHVIFQSMFIKYCFSTRRTLGTIQILRKDVWNAGFS